MKKNYDEIFPDKREELSNESLLKQSQYVMLRILKIVADILEENDITYWLASGTLLGAIRHKGFIPWDDDIDIGIFYSEYDKAAKALKENLPDDLFLQSLETDKYYDLPWMKVKDNNSYIFEYKPGKYHRGIFIDIFPMEEVTQDNQKILKARKKMRMIHRVLSSIKEPFDKITSVKMFIKDIYKLFIKVILFPLTLSSQETKNKLIKKAAENAANAIREDGSGIMSYYGGIPFFNAKVDKNILLPLEKVKFEDHEFYAPKQYDKYLTSEYGDYMTLPPEDKRHSHNIKLIPDLKHNKSNLKEF
ncbi:MAG: LicD family protein [Inconstantimicrobium porci]|uniref:LicD family protein n=1 Tax=Inconstantimicrobium porci TaxID=2652291 RepID=UPI002A91C51A|nr:LicD family protein [Inconstantimicrobium porci]MDY5911576.1 LicD family protein [Inconstantimicrobium porci]